MDARDQHGHDVDGAEMAVHTSNRFALPAPLCPHPYPVYSMMCGPRPQRSAM